MVTGRKLRRRRLRWTCSTLERITESGEDFATLSQLRSAERHTTCPLGTTMRLSLSMPSGWRSGVAVRVSGGWLMFVDERPPAP